MKAAPELHIFSDMLLADAAKKLPTKSKRGKGGGNSEAMLAGDELPDGRKLNELGPAALATALSEMKISGVTTHNSQPANVALYRQFVCDRYVQGGHDALADLDMSGAGMADEMRDSEAEQ
jgi:hypothetical protein